MILANDFRRQWEDVRVDAVSAFERVGRTGWYVLGEDVRGFEAGLAEYWGIAHAVGVASGLDAIEISLKALGCGPGDRVLTTPLSAFATTLAIVKLGAVPVFVDTNEFGLIDLGRCLEVIASRPEVRYFVPVHLYGHALDVRVLRGISEKLCVAVVEDCAQSIGARFRGEATGSGGDLAATSFYPTKNLGAFGDGGAILTSSDELRTKVAALRDYGQTAKYRHEEIGYNSRLDEIQAAILRDAMLPRIAGWIERRQSIAALYLGGIKNAEVRCMGAPEGSESSWHLFPVLVDPERKREFIEHLRRCGVAAGEHYPLAIPDQPAMAKVPFEMADDCARARRIAASEVSLPLHPYLTDEECGLVIDAVNAW
jgi:dTDP-4-amino-4,6-dideoxygalactose transaminase